MGPVLNKANGHIVQVDWNETDPTSFSFIHNKPTEEDIQQLIRNELFNEGGTLTDLDFTWNSETKSWNKDPLKTYYGHTSIELDGLNEAGNIMFEHNPPIPMLWWNLKGELIAPSWGEAPPFIKQTLTIGEADKEFFRYFSADTMSWRPWRAYMDKGVRYDVANGLKEHEQFDHVYGGVMNFQTNTMQRVAIPVMDTAVEFCYVPVTDNTGELAIRNNPTKDTSAVNKGYVDQYQVKHTNKAKSIYTNTVRLGDLDWVPDMDGTNLSMNGHSIAKVPLPEDPNNELVYTVRLSNMPTPLELYNAGGYFWGWGPGVGVMPDADYLEDLNEWCWDEGNIEINDSLGKVSYLWFGEYIDTPAKTKEATWTGNWVIVAGEGCGDGTDLYTYIPDAILEYSCSISEGGFEGPVHSIDLHSDEELHYDYPVTELTINNLVRCLPKNMRQQWVISFIAGDAAPIVTVPHQVELTSIPMRDEASSTSESFPLEWVGGEPSFEANKRYIITFKQINAVVYASCVELPDTH